MPKEKKTRKSKKKKTACFKTIKVTKWIFYLAWAAALGYTLFNISKSLDKFLSKPVSTKITVYHNEDGKMRFPTISLCNLNMVSSNLFPAISFGFVGVTLLKTLHTCTVVTSMA